MIDSTAIVLHADAVRRREREARRARIVGDRAIPSADALRATIRRDRYTGPLYRYACSCGLLLATLQQGPAPCSCRVVDDVAEDAAAGRLATRNVRVDTSHPRTRADRAAIGAIALLCVLVLGVLASSVMQAWYDRDQLPPSRTVSAFDAGGRR